MSDEASPATDDGLSDDAVRGMVRTIEPGWSVESVERSDYGTDFVATLDVRTDGGGRTVVLKATTADLVDPEIARSEPRLLDLADGETSIPVPTVFGYRDEHEAYPAPFYLMEHVDGENFEDDPHGLSPAARERVIREAGENLAELHELGPLPAFGGVGVEDGQLAVLDRGDHERYDDGREWLLNGFEETLDALDDGGWFAELADDPERFVDLVPELREYVREAVPELPSLDRPTYCHWDYRYGNLLVDPETGATRAVLDWANLCAAEPAYNLAKAECHLLSPEDDGDERTGELRRLFRRAYADARDEWSFDADTRKRMKLYELEWRLGAMGCLPLWHEDATPADRDERAAEHRAFVERYI